MNNNRVVPIAVVSVLAAAIGYTLWTRGDNTPTAAPTTSTSSMSAPTPTIPNTTSTPTGTSAPPPTNTVTLRPGDPVPGRTDKTIGRADHGSTITPGAVTAGQAAAALAYLDARENQVSAPMKDPGSWIDKAAGHLTAKFANQLRNDAETAGTGPYWNDTHEADLAVKVTGDCTYSTDAGTPTSSYAVIACTITDQVITGDGQPASLLDIPDLFPYNGTGKKALLELVGDGGTWKVNNDWTGRAAG